MVGRGTQPGPGRRNPPSRIRSVCPRGIRVSDHVSDAYGSCMEDTQRDGYTALAKKMIHKHGERGQRHGSWTSVASLLPLWRPAGA